MKPKVSKGIKFKIKRWQKRIKGAKFAKKTFATLIVLINLGITLWGIYDQHLKERIEER